MTRTILGRRGLIFWCARGFSVTSQVWAAGKKFCLRTVTSNAQCACQHTCHSPQVTLLKPWALLGHSRHQVSLGFLFLAPQPSLSTATTSELRQSLCRLGCWTRPHSCPEQQLVMTLFFWA